MMGLQQATHHVMFPVLLIVQSGKLHLVGTTHDSGIPASLGSLCTVSGGGGALAAQYTILSVTERFGDSQHNTHFYLLHRGLRIGDAQHNTQFYLLQNPLVTHSTIHNSIC